MSPAKPTKPAIMWPAPCQDRVVVGAAPTG